MTIEVELVPPDDSPQASRGPTPKRIIVTVPRGSDTYTAELDVLGRAAFAPDDLQFQDIALTATETPLADFAPLSDAFKHLFHTLYRAVPERHQHREKPELLRYRGGAVGDRGVVRDEDGDSATTERVRV